jgi:hypothetical protein
MKINVSWIFLRTLRSSDLIEILEKPKCVFNGMYLAKEQMQM